MKIALRILPVAFVCVALGGVLPLPQKEVAGSLPMVFLMLPLRAQTARKRNGRR